MFSHDATISMIEYNFLYNYPQWYDNFSFGRWKIFYESMIIYFVKYLVEHVLFGIQDNYRSSQSRIDWCTLIHCIISSIYRQESIVLSSFVVIVVKDKSR